MGLDQWQLNSTANLTTEITTMPLFIGTGSLLKDALKTETSAKKKKN